MQVRFENGLPLIEYTLHDERGVFELVEFVESMTGLSRAFAQYIAEKHPNLEEEARIFIKEMRPGSIITELVPWFVIAQPFVQELFKEAVIDAFIEWAKITMRRIVHGDTPPPPRTVDAVAAFVAPIAKNETAVGRLASVEIYDGRTKSRARLEFTHPEALEVLKSAHEILGAKNNENTKIYDRVLMEITRADRREQKTGARTGELAIIREIEEKAHPIIYATDLARQRIKSEILGEENIFKKGFVVDVIAIYKNDKPYVYKIIDVHDVIVLPDDD